MRLIEFVSKLFLKIRASHPCRSFLRQTRLSDMKFLQKSESILAVVPLLLLRPNQDVYFCGLFFLSPNIETPSVHETSGSI